MKQNHLKEILDLLEDIRSKQANANKDVVEIQQSVEEIQQSIDDIRNALHTADKERAIKALLSGGQIAQFVKIIYEFFSSP